MAASQAAQQEMQMKAQIDAQMKQIEHQMEMERMQLEYSLKKEIEMIKASSVAGMKVNEQEFKKQIEAEKDDRKDERVKKQAVEQSKLISQRDGNRGELKGSTEATEQQVNPEEMINQIIGQ
jgi:hypothetical protein